MKSDKLIIFRADGNSVSGLGHLYRLFALVEVLKGDFNYVFVTKESTQLSVIPNDYPLELIPDGVLLEDEPKWLLDEFIGENNIIIADGYQFKSCYQKRLKNLGAKLIYIDDLTEWHMYADIVINHSLGVSDENYLSEDYTIFALGCDYALLRPSFLKETRRKRIINNIDSVFICFGGADPFGLTIKAIRACMNFNKIKIINVVIGAAYSNKGIYDLFNQDSRVRIYQNISEVEMIEVMKKSNLAIAPSSTILYELCSVRMPIISGYYVNNQERIYNGFLNKDAIYGIGDISKFQTSDFKKAIESFIQTNSIDKYYKKQESLFDGKIEKRFLKLIKKVC